MSKRSDYETVGPDVKAAHYFKQAYSALAHALKGGPDTPQIERISVAFRAGGPMVIVTAVELPTLRPVVCFGSGADLATALRNVNLAIQKGQWRADKYRK